MSLRSSFRVAFMALVAVCAGAGVSLAQSATREVTTGGRVEIAVKAVDPDGDPLTYRWETTGGRIIGTGERVTFDATGLAPGTYTATVTVSDSLCEDSTSVAIRVLAPPAPPAPERAGGCVFPRSSARANNACKAILDDAALGLGRDPRLVLVVDGHAAPGERAGIALARAEAARAYLVSERGIDASRVLVRSFDERCPAGDAAASRRIDLNLLPEGARAEDVRPCP